MDLNSACLVVDGHPLLTQPWQLGFMQDLPCPTELQWVEEWNVFRPWMVCCCSGTWHTATAMVWNTYPPDIWAPWKPVWDTPGPFWRPPHWSSVPSMITWWLLMLTTQLPLITACDVWLVTSGGPRAFVPWSRWSSRPTWSALIARPLSDNLADPTGDNCRWPIILHCSR